MSYDTASSLETIMISHSGVGSKLKVGGVAARLIENLDYIYITKKRIVVKVMFRFLKKGGGG